MRLTLFGLSVFCLILGVATEDRFFLFIAMWAAVAGLYFDR